MIFEDVRIVAMTKDSRVGWRDDRFMVDYIYNCCSGGLEKNIFWEEKNVCFNIFVVSKNKSQRGSLLSPSPTPP